MTRSRIEWGILLALFVTMIAACALSPTSTQQVHEPPTTSVHPWQTTTTVVSSPMPSCVPGTVAGGSCW